MHMRTIWPCLFLAVAACGGPNKSLSLVNGAIDGFVYLTAPVGGVVVTAYPIDLETGKVSSQGIAHSAPTAPDGAFHLELGIYFGPLLLRARGAEGSYVDPASGQPVKWDAAQELRALWFTLSDSGTLTFDYARGTHLTGVTISPWSDLAFAASLGRMDTTGKDIFRDTFQNVALLFHDHTELDYWSVQPVDLTADDMRTWSDPVQLGLEGAGLAQLAARMAADSKTGGITSMQLLRVLDRDAEDGIFDGRDHDGGLILGTCKAECTISDQTLRSDFSDSMSLFLKSPTNQSTIAPAAINDFLVRVAMRHNDLFPAGGSANTYDVTPPTVAVVESNVIDQPSGKSVPLVAGAIAMFSRYITDYGPTEMGIPKWHYLIQDDHTDDSAIVVQAHLLREDKELVPWTTVPYSDAGSGWNREVAISSALEPSIASTSGNYQLEIRATDQKGNVSSITAVKWTQTILPARAPSIAIVPTTALDERNVVASITGGGVGVAHYTNAPVVVTLDGAGMPSFARFASHCAPDDNGVPRWRFLITAGKETDLMKVQARLLREDNNSELVPWFELPAVSGVGYNYEIIASNALHRDLGLISGSFRIEVKATDTTEAVSTSASVPWNQTIITPPLRQRAAPDCDDVADPECPSYYSLANSRNATTAIKGGTGLVHGLKIGHVFIDNPNPVPVRAAIASLALISFQRGRKHITVPVEPFGYKAGCSPTQDPNGNCYLAPKPDVETLDGSEVDPLRGAPMVQVDIGGTVLSQCPGCVADEYEIPAHTIANVWLFWKPFSFLWGPYPLGPNSPGLPSTSLGGPCEKYVSHANEGTVFFQVHWYFTRILVAPSIRSTITSRPADSRVSLTAGPGNDLTNFAVPAPKWKTSAPGEPSF